MDKGKLHTRIYALSKCIIYYKVIKSYLRFGYVSPGFSLILLTTIVFLRLSFFLEYQKMFCEEVPIMVLGCRLIFQVSVFNNLI